MCWRNKMKVELPLFQRCCLCIPLRHGLLGWGYIKLVTTLLLLVFLILVFQAMNFDRLMPSNQLLVVVILTVILLDLVFNGIFVVGAHRKNPKLLKMYYYYGMVGLVALMILACLHLSYHLNRMATQCQSYCTMGYIIDPILMVTGFIVGNILIQYYLILLTRSEIMKRESDQSVSFVNEAASDANAESARKKMQQMVKYGQLCNEDTVDV